MADAHEPPSQSGGGVTRSYVVVGITLGVLTIIVLALAYAGVPVAILVPIVVVLAAVQVYLQADVWMHLNHGRRLYAIFFVAGGLLAITIIFTAMVLMWQT